MSTSNDHKKTQPRKGFSAPPFSIIVTAVSEMPIAVTRLPTERIIDVKIDPEMQDALFEILKKHRASKNTGLLSITFRGLSR